MVRAKNAIFHPYWKGDGLDFQISYDLLLFHLQEPMDLGSPVLAASGTTSTPKQVYGSRNFLGFRPGESLETALFVIVENRLCPNLTVLTACFCIFSNEALMVVGKYTVQDRLVAHCCSEW